MFLATNDPRWSIVSLPERIGGIPLPPVQIVDMREELRTGNRTVLSRALRAALTETLAAGKQAILFQNRRGYSTFLLCRACGLVMECPRCAVSLTYHRDGTVHCHYCGHHAMPPSVCPRCQSHYFRYFGTGTQKVEAELAAMFPQARVLRMDKDTTRRQGAHEKLLSEFAQGKADILLGTQMIAKGHDFPRVNLVGVISADTALNLPDFRAGERTFQLMTQVAGRAGRSDDTRDSQVVVQTYHPDHYAITSAATHDYQSFASQELAFRQELNYPPYVRLVLVSVSSKNEKAASGVIPGLIPAPIPRLRGEYRYQKLFRENEIPRRELETLAELNIPGMKVDIDVDPMDLL
jgi:primosomal protein N' (replication factor Y)